MGINSSATSGSGYRMRPDLIWCAFDKLPVDVRKALSEAAAPWVPQPLVTMLKEGKSEQACINAVRRWDAEEIVAARKSV